MWCYGGEQELDLLFLKGLMWLLKHSVLSRGYRGLRISPEMLCLCCTILGVHESDLTWSMSLQWCNYIKAIKMMKLCGLWKWDLHWIMWSYKRKSHRTLRQGMVTQRHKGRDIRTIEEREKSRKANRLQNREKGTNPPLDFPERINVVLWDAQSVVTRCSRHWKLTEDRHGLFLSEYLDFNSCNMWHKLVFGDFGLNIIQVIPIVVSLLWVN